VNFSTAESHPFDDVRDLTRETRVRIGFSRPDRWRDAPADFGPEALTIEGHPVMEAWETEYMRELAEVATRRGGTILEIGYGMGISAGFIQTYEICEHLIIEMNRQVHERAVAFARSSPRKTRPLFGRWEDITPLLPSGSVTGILFDTYPLSEDEIHKNHFRFFPEAYRLLAPGGTLTYYSDEIEDFSTEHIEALRKAGFTSIKGRVCQVNPPDDCLYWRSPTILTPIITR
jgi:guanidinoacetate N-methyltransferase